MGTGRAMLPPHLEVPFDESHFRPTDDRRAPGRPVGHIVSRESGWSFGRTLCGVRASRIAQAAVFLHPDTDAPGTMSGVAGSSTAYGGPTLVSTATPGLIASNHFHLGTA